MTFEEWWEENAGCLTSERKFALVAWTELEAEIKQLKSDVEFWKEACRRIDAAWLRRYKLQEKQ